MTQYAYGYDHKRKEINFMLTIGSQAPVNFTMSAEAFLQDLVFMNKDPQLAHFLTEVKKRKDLPIDYDFGAGGSEIKFDPKEWEDRMKDE